MLRDAAGSISNADKDFRLPGFDFLWEMGTKAFLTRFCSGGGGGEGREGACRWALSLFFFAFRRSLREGFFPGGLELCCSTAATLVARAIETTYSTPDFFLHQCVRRGIKADCFFVEFNSLNHAIHGAYSICVPGAPYPNCNCLTVCWDSKRSYIMGVFDDPCNAVMTKAATVSHTHLHASWYVWKSVREQKIGWRKREVGWKTNWSWMNFIFERV